MLRENGLSGRKGLAAFVSGAVGVMALYFATGCSQTPPPGPETHSAASINRGVAGGTYVDTIKMTVKVVSIDAKARKLTLMDSDKKTFDVEVGPAAVNFDQIRPNDLVNVVLTKEMVVSVKEKGDVVAEGEAALVALAPEGAKPGGVVAHSRQITADVIAIDRNAHTATLKFTNGEVKMFPVRPDVDLGNYAVGQQVVIQVTNMVAISVDEAEKSSK